MKIAIFCCLLAFCAFEICHAELDSELDTLYDKSVAKATAYVATTNKTFQDLLDAAKSEKKNTDVCENNFTKSVETHLSNVKEIFQTEVDDARKSKRIRQTQNFCPRLINAFKTGIDDLLDEAKKCISGSPDL